MKFAVVASLFIAWAVGTTAYAQQLTCSQAVSTCKTACPDNAQTHTPCPGICDQKFADCMKTGVWRRLDGATLPARKE